MNIENDIGQALLIEFPEVAQTFLRGFYAGRGVSLDDTIAKIKAIRDGFGLNDAIVAADGSVSSDDEELNLLEFYVLTKRGII
jgi:hypothetical protein